AWVAGLGFPSSSLGYHRRCLHLSYHRHLISSKPTVLFVKLLKSADPLHVLSPLSKLL
ncbi:hypothetical protein CCACVL1_01090, partial [Corchorus capsularis]